MYSLLVIKNGYLIAEGYYNSQTMNDANHIHSASKSFTSALVGIALRENYLHSLDQKIIPEEWVEASWQNTGQGNYDWIPLEEHVYGYQWWMGEVDDRTFEYWDVGVVSDHLYHYALIAVRDDGTESLPIYFSD